MSRREQIMRSFDAQREWLQETAQQGIERNRKGWAQVQVTDAQGSPLPGARVHAEQRSHDFRFGANLFMLGQFNTPEKNAAYEQRFAELFNMATLPFYWSDLEPEKGKLRFDRNSPAIYRRPPIDTCLDFCAAHGIEPREHALAYERFFPEWLYDADVFTVKRELSRRMREVAEHCGDRIRTMEVTNEMYWGKGRTAFYDEDDYISWCFNEARKYMGANQLVINEWSGFWEDRGTSRDWYYALIERELLRGTPIDAVGMQYHMFFPAEEEAERTRKYYDPQHLTRILDRYGRFGLPLQITEVTVPAYTDRAEDEALQAELLTNLYTLWFSHERMEQIVYWNLPDGYAAFAPQGDMTAGENYYRGGLLRFDLTPKPAYEALYDLIHVKWHTSADSQTAADGSAAFKGFYGDYDLTAEWNGRTVKKTVHLAKGRDNAFTLAL